MSVKITINLHINYVMFYDCTDRKNLLLFLLQSSEDKTRKSLAVWLQLSAIAGDRQWTLVGYFNFFAILTDVAVCHQRNIVFVCY